MRALGIFDDPAIVIGLASALSEFHGQMTVFDKSANDLLVGAPLLGKAMIGERPVHGLDDVVSLAELLQGRLSFVGHKPASGLSSVARP